jgi:hypothetical protein
MATDLESMLINNYAHNNRSDIYFICLMKPLSRDINKDDHEIDKCQWTPLKDYFAMTHLRAVQLAAKEAVKNYLADPSKCLTSTDISYKDSKARLYSV